MKLLGIDYGEKKIGLAFSEGRLSMPSTGSALINTDNCVGIIKDICQDQSVRRIVVGIIPGRLEKKIRKFGKNLQKSTGLPVDYHDETLSTKQAGLELVNLGKSRKKRKKTEHHVAAAIILQDYIDNFKKADLFNDKC